MMKNNKQYPVLQQSTKALQQAAELANVMTQATARVSPASAGKTHTVVAAPKATSSKDLWVSIFFDGTGNNLNADLGTNEHSNVARLYLAHEEDDPSKGYFRIYVPGLGTLFKDISDEGGAFGNGFGRWGEKRLNWVMSQLEVHLQRASKSGARLNISLFGFSRGATLARAFARRIANHSEQKADVWRIATHGCPISIYFMGLFDTVASVGLAMSANNGGALGQVSVKGAMNRRLDVTRRNSLARVAMGTDPGADPASGPFDGHAAWANDLRVPSMVEQCVHMVAAHEIRNSFPLDSALEGRNYPKNCVEIVYPGVHSDIGGGYRPGEGARGSTSGAMLSLIPLRRMWDIASLAGVPLVQDRDKRQLRDMGMDSESMKDFPSMADRFNHYMRSLEESATASLGKQMLAHMKLYYQWRFHKIARDQGTRKTHNSTRDEVRLSMSEPVWLAEKLQKTERMKQLKKEGEKYSNQLAAQNWNSVSTGQPPTAEQIASLQQLRTLAEQKNAAYLEAKAVVDTMPGSDGALAKSLKVYDEQLLNDALLLKVLSRFRPLRPHYKALLEAYENQFEKGKGLRDEQVIAFFDDYVHDSLAGFAQDATLPSDPRVIYIEGDNKLKYAMNEAIRSSIADIG